jgi:cytidylate kinase
MKHAKSPAFLNHYLNQVGQHWETRQRAEAKEGGSRAPRVPTVALEREAGILGTSVAREVGRRLDWPVYDHELLERIAQEMGLQTKLLESVDEKRVPWLHDAFQALCAVPRVNENTYAHQLAKTILALGAHGQCVIVGRGAAQILPAETTLRVRLVAPDHDRIEALAERHALSRAEARQRMSAIDLERTSFVRDHFVKDPTDPGNYDLLLNFSRFGVADSADLIVSALWRLQASMVEARTGPAAANVHA